MKCQTSHLNDFSHGAAERSEGGRSGWPSPLLKFLFEILNSLVIAEAETKNDSVFKSMEKLFVFGRSQAQ